MSYDKTIVCDIDDTISFTTSRDWKNAEPNTKLINKLNKLYDEGWEIQYYTARGSISCPNREAAKEKYLDDIIAWFNKNSVKYSKISFDKPLAAYYIDDKGITPDEFLDFDIEVLSGGLSGASIERRGNKVYKTASNSIEVAKWYSEASNYIIVPQVHSLIGNTLCLDYIQKTDTPKMYQVNKILNIFKRIPKDVPFSNYIERIRHHLELYHPKYAVSVLMHLESIEALANKNKSFMHGDFSLDNIINNNNTLYLIDPNYSEGSYSSWLLDISKLMQSAQRFNNVYIYNYIIDQYKNDPELLEAIMILALTHWIRMRKYAINKKEVDYNCVNLYRNLQGFY